MQSTVQSVLNMKELRSKCSKGLEVPCQNTFKDKPAFIKRLIKVLVDLTQEIQFLEFIGGSNFPQAFPNYLICMRFIRINTVTDNQG